jgi:hypothetical protein
MNNRKNRVEKWVEKIIRKTMEEEGQVNSFYSYSQKYFRKPITNLIMRSPSGENADSW